MVRAFPETPVVGSDTLGVEFLFHQISPSGPHYNYSIFLSLTGSLSIPPHSLFLFTPSPCPSSSPSPKLHAPLLQLDPKPIEASNCRGEPSSPRVPP